MVPFIYPMSAPCGTVKQDLKSGESGSTKAPFCILKPALDGAR